MTFIEKIKANSSGWIKTRHESLENFYWQNGYGGFSVGPEEVEGIARYISNQHEHHRDITFQDEYRKTLKDHNVEYDERYVWD